MVPTATCGVARLWLAGEGAALEIRKLYQKAQAGDRLTVSDSAPAEIAQAAIDYVLRQWQ